MCRVGRGTLGSFRAVRLVASHKGVDRALGQVANVVDVTQLSHALANGSLWLECRLPPGENK